jgi:hypothetical protein
MSQMGAIVVNDTIKVDAWIAKVKEENPKAQVGPIEKTDSGIRYIAISKV